MDLRFVQTSTLSALVNCDAEAEVRVCTRREGECSLLSRLRAVLTRPQLHLFRVGNLPPWTARSVSGTPQRQLWEDVSVLATSQSSARQLVV